MGVVVLCERDGLLTVEKKTETPEMSETVEKTADQNVNAESESQEPKGEAKSVDELPEWARKELSEARSEAAGYRTSLRELQEKVSGMKTVDEVESLIAQANERADKAEAARQIAQDRLAVQAEFVNLPAGVFELMPDGKLEDMRAWAEKMGGIVAESKPKNAGSGIKRPGGGVEPSQDSSDHFDVNEVIKSIPRW